MYNTIASSQNHRSSVVKSNHLIEDCLHKTTVYLVELYLSVGGQYL